MTYEEAREYFKRKVISNDGYFSERLANETALKALNKAVELKPIPYEKYYFMCPFCKHDLGIEKDDIFVYDMSPPNHCENCGQALDWSDTK